MEALVSAEERKRAKFHRPALSPLACRSRTDKQTNKPAGMEDLCLGARVAIEAVKSDVTKFCMLAALV